MSTSVHIVLASSSPRRLQLLAPLGHAITVRAADIDETEHPGEDPVAYVRRLSLEKAAVVIDLHATTIGADDVVIAADTTVDLDGHILGKPADGAEARQMLRRLSGVTHRVHTGVTVRRGDRVATDVCTTLVTFVTVDDAAAQWYVDTGEPFDKAGAYALQGAGGVFVSAVEGSVSNVVGLPLATVVDLARRVGVDLLAG